MAHWGLLRQKQTKTEVSAYKPFEVIVMSHALMSSQNHVMVNLWDRLSL